MLVNKMRSATTAAIFIAMLAVSHMAICSQESQSPLQHKRVLLLYSYHPAFITSEILLDGVWSVLAPYHLTLDIEYMDSKRHSSERYVQQFAELLKEKFSHTAPYDVIIVSDDNALNFAIKNQQYLFRNVPIVFMAVNDVDTAIRMDSNPYITGVIEAIAPEKTINLARKLNPQLKSITIVVDDTRSGKADLDIVERLYNKFPDLLFNVLQTGDYSWPEVAELLKQQHKDSVLLGLAAFRDKTGLVLSYEESIGLIVRNSPVPVYVLREHGVKHGALGGYVVSFYEQGRQAAMMTEKILKGTPVQDIKVLRNSPNQYMFDYPSLQRFAVGESLLPDNSIILNKPETIFEQYTRYVWAALAAFILLVGFIVFLLFEINARRRVETTLKNYQDHLEEIVKGRTTELEAANKDLESFSYSVSHDLRAPLRGIDGYCQILIDDYGQLLDAEGKGYLGRIRTGAQHMANLIDDLLELSRVTRRNLELEPLDLSAMAAEIVERLKKANEGRQVKIFIQPGMQARGDRHLIEIVLQNLLDNAWKYTSKTAHAEVEFNYQKAGTEQVYYVRDNGAGFDMQYANKLFKAFQRLHGIDEFPGTGIGLATVRRVIKRHGGIVWAEGEVDKGAIFYFTLPQ